MPREFRNPAPAVNFLSSTEGGDSMYLKAATRTSREIEQHVACEAGDPLPRRYAVVMGTIILAMAGIVAFSHFYAKELLGLDPGSAIAEIMGYAAACTILLGGTIVSMGYLITKKYFIKTTTVIVALAFATQLYGMVSVADIRSEFIRAVDEVKTANSSGLDNAMPKADIKRIIQKRDARLSGRGLTAVDGWYYESRFNSGQTWVWTAYAPAPWKLLQR